MTTADILDFIAELRRHRGLRKVEDDRDRLPQLDEDRGADVAAAPPDPPR